MIKISKADKILRTLKIKTDRLTIEPICLYYKKDYMRLYLDDEVNKYYGYDYKTDLGDKEPTADYFFEFQEKLKDTEHEYSFMALYHNKFAGEFVCYNITENSYEVGFRFLKCYQGLGLAFEGLTEFIKNVSKKIDFNVVRAKTYIENIRSQRLLLKTGFIEISKDDKYLYFEKRI